jgi:hypothetical protein
MLCRSSAAGAIHCVASTGGTTTAPCVNSTAYTTIQAAVTAASNSDEIRIAHGTYTATDQYVVSIIDKSLTLRGGYASSIGYIALQGIQPDDQGCLALVGLVGDWEATVARKLAHRLALGQRE